MVFPLIYFTIFLLLPLFVLPLFVLKLPLSTERWAPVIIHYLFINQVNEITDHTLPAHLSFRESSGKETHTNLCSMPQMTIRKSNRLCHCGNHLTLKQNVDTAYLIHSVANLRDLLPNLSQIANSSPTFYNFSNYLALPEKYDRRSRFKLFTRSRRSKLNTEQRLHTQVGNHVHVLSSFSGGQVQERSSI